MLIIQDTVLVVIDVQGKLASLVHEHEKLLNNIERVIKSALALEMPILWTEQVPEKLGDTVKPIRDLLFPLIKPIPKKSFSCYDCLEFVNHLKQVNRSQVLITGIESHVCVYQTARDLSHFGFDVHLLADAVSSRHHVNHDLAIARMRVEGITISSAEMALCELIKTSHHPVFKEIMTNIKR